MKDSYPLVPPGAFVTNLSATIRAAIIYQKQLEILKSLRSNTIKAFGQIGFHLVDWNDNRYQRAFIHDRIHLTSIKHHI